MDPHSTRHALAQGTQALQESPAAAAALPSKPGVSISWSWLAAALDEIDYGMLLVSQDAHVEHANQLARTELDGDHPLQLRGGRLCSRYLRDAAPLHSALENATRRGLRKLLTLGEAEHRVGISVVPLARADAADGAATLVMLGKKRMCERLSVQGYARSHGLTAAETRVLETLCGGASPNQIAAHLGVAISTVRSQIGSIRTRTGAESIGALLKDIAVLPPMMGVLRENRSRLSGV